ncbi:glyoxalase [Novosphingobium sp. TH158]|uniref:glyoxalase n=1 Tax=Novosphingobium sp. TH158 TaxID=2067455 RepID=UPI000C79C825|nr:glyoxalase [Novosphingobium sp. TH158]PLK27885.1 glyoxalase [Novosphingobium sp. TH158]
MAWLPLAHISWAIADNADRPACDAFILDLFGAQTAYEMLVTPETAHYRFDREERLMVVGDTMLIPIAPAGPGAEPGNPLGDMLRRSAGENRWIGLAFRAADLPAAARWFESRDFSLHFDCGMEDKYFLISKRQVLGIRIEVMQGELPGDPRLKPDWAPQRWAQDHPLGIEGLLSVDVAAPDLAEARDLFGTRLELPLLSERELPGEGAKGIAFRLCDTVMEALSPPPQGASGMCGITFKVRSAQAAWDHLAARGFTLRGSADTRFAIEPAEAHGRLIWFSEHLPAGWPAPGSSLRAPDPVPGLPDGATAPAS